MASQFHSGERIADVNDVFKTNQVALLTNALELDFPELLIPGAASLNSINGELSSIEYDFISDF